MSREFRIYRRHYISCWQRKDISRDRISWLCLLSVSVSSAAEKKSPWRLCVCDILSFLYHVHLLISISTLDSQIFTPTLPVIPRGVSQTLFFSVLFMVKMAHYHQVPNRPVDPESMRRWLAPVCRLFERQNQERSLKTHDGRRVPKTFMMKGDQ